jgi:hypothetical protein
MTRFLSLVTQAVSLRQGHSQTNSLRYKAADYTCAGFDVDDLSRIQATPLPSATT